MQYTVLVSALTTAPRFDVWHDLRQPTRLLLPGVWHITSTWGQSRCQEVGPASFQCPSRGSWVDIGHCFLFLSRQLGAPAQVLLVGLHGLSFLPEEGGREIPYTLLFYRVGTMALITCGRRGQPHSSNRPGRPRQGRGPDSTCGCTVSNGKRQPDEVAIPGVLLIRTHPKWQS